MLRASHATLPRGVIEMIFRFPTARSCDCNSTLSELFMTKLSFPFSEEKSAR